jgi:phage terminase large subunit-like protein
MNEKERKKRELISALQNMRKSDPWKFYKPYESRECDSPYYFPGRKPQEIAHSSNARIVMMLSGNRAGKTEYNIMECIYRNTGAHPYKPKWNIDTNPRCVPNHGWVIMPDWANHGANVILPKFNAMKPKYLKWHPSDRIFVNERNGSTIGIKSAESGREKFQGADLDWASIDEEIAYDIAAETRMRLIDRAGDMWLTMTPLKGMTWTLDEIYEPWKNGEVPTSEIEVIQMGMAENPHIPLSEVKLIERMYSDDPLLSARLYGQYVQLAGLVYPTFNARETHKLDGGVWSVGTRKVFCSIDFGFTNPFCTLWLAVGGDGELYVFDEYYKTETAISDHVDEIKRRNRLWGINPSYYVADPEEAQSRFEMSQQGISTILADKKFMEGMNRVREYLKIRDNGKPLLYVHPRCKELIWEMGRYQFKERGRGAQELNTYEMAEKKHDHGPDALRYAVMSRPSPFEMAKPRPPAGSMTDWDSKIKEPRKGKIQP